MGGQRHAPTALPRETNPVPIVQEYGWAPGLVWSGAINLNPPAGIRSPGRRARNESPYSLRHPGPLNSGFHTETLTNDVLLTISAQWSLYVTPGLTQFYVLPTQLYLCVLCGSENKQQLFPYTTLIDWFV